MTGGGLYQEAILDHCKHPRGCGALPEADRVAEGLNPACGDQVTLYLRLDGDRVADLRFEASACAITRASASMMTEALRGRTRDEARRLAERFFRAVGMEPEGNPEPLPGELAVFTAVRDFPGRERCAALPWHALRSALSDLE